MKILKKILPQTLKIIIIEYRHFFKEKRKKHKKKLRDLISNNKEKSLIIDDEDKWIKKLNKLTYAKPNFIKIGEYFAKSEIEIIKKIKIEKNDIIAICVEKNDLVKLKRFILHYRKIGVNRFIILDNNSNDGTMDWLMKQEDIIILKTNEKYNTLKRIAWINRIIAYFGDNRWYLVADSDELLVYDNCENKRIQDIVKYCKKNRIIRARAIMIDMYAKPEYYTTRNIENFYEECVYFDTNTYYLKNRDYFMNIHGGPRERMFNISPCLTKYPLVYIRKKDVYCNSHYLYPYSKNFNKNCQLILKHYKFLPGEIERYKKIVVEENYYNKSEEYKKYLEVLNNKDVLNFFCDSTVKYDSSKSLKKINMY